MCREFRPVGREPARGCKMGQLVEHYQAISMVLDDTESSTPPEWLVNSEIRAHPARRPAGPSPPPKPGPLHIDVVSLEAPPAAAHEEWVTSKRYLRMEPLPEQREAEREQALEAAT